MSTVEQVMDLLIEHTRINPPSGECSCGFIGQLGRRFTEHQAQELHKAGLLRPDLEDDFGLSKVELTFGVDKPTHVHIERRGVPIVDGYIEGPRRAVVVHPDTATTEGTCPGGC